MSELTDQGSTTGDNRSWFMDSNYPNDKVVVLGG